MLKRFIVQVAGGRDLSEKEMEEAMGILLNGSATPTQIGAFITALRMKGETVEEITGAARIMRSKVERIYLQNHLVNMDRDEINVEEETILDTCGTGGDGTNTFNVSTTTAFVVAGSGIRVAKHGNRAVSSRCGSADVLEKLGVKLDINTTDVENCINDVGMGFLYAPLFHGAMKHAAAPRREIGIRTIFNLLGPLTNPAGANAQVLGVYVPELTEKIAHVLKNLGTREAFVVCGEGTYDEISICGPTKVSHLKEGEVKTDEITPEMYGFNRAAPESILGGDAEKNAEIVRDILNGGNGSKRDLVLLNAAAAFIVAGLDNSFSDGIERAKESIDSGRAAEKLNRLIAFTQGCGAFVRKDLSN